MDKNNSQARNPYTQPNRAPHIDRMGLKILGVSGKINLVHSKASRVLACLSSLNILKLAAMAHVKLLRIHTERKCQFRKDYSHR